MKNAIHNFLTIRNSNSLYRIKCLLLKELIGKFLNQATFSVNFAGLYLIVVGRKAQRFTTSFKIFFFFCFIPINTNY